MNISQILTKLKSLVYSKSEADTLLSSKASSSHKHTKSEITDFPTIPSKTSQLTNDSGFITGVSWDNVSGKPSTFTPSSHTHTKSQITDFPSLATVATSGSYNDLSNKPSIPSIDLRPQASADANTVSDGVSITHYGSNGPATSLGASTNDGALFQQCWSSAWKVQIAADYRNGNLFTRGKNNGTWQPWRAVAYHGDNVSKFTNDSGYITSSGSCSYSTTSGTSTYSTYLKSLGAQTPKSGRDIFHSGVYTYTTYTDTNTPAHYGAVIGYGNGQGGSCEMFAEWVGRGNLWFRVLRDCDDSWTNWQQIITSDNIGSQSVNYANSAGSARTVTDSSCINPTSGNYSEGIRFNKSTNGWTAITIGTASGTTNGAMNGTGWGIFCDTSDNFIINNFDSSTTNAALYCSDTNTYIPNLHISGGYKIYVG